MNLKSWKEEYFRQKEEKSSYEREQEKLRETFKPLLMEYEEYLKLSGRSSSSGSFITFLKLLKLENCSETFYLTLDNEKYTITFKVFGTLRFTSTCFEVSNGVVSVDILEFSY